MVFDCIAFQVKVLKMTNFDGGRCQLSVELVELIVGGVGYLLELVEVGVSWPEQHGYKKRKKIEMTQLMIFFFFVVIFDCIDFQVEV